MVRYIFYYKKNTIIYIVEELQDSKIQSINNYNYARTVKL